MLRRSDSSKRRPPACRGSGGGEAVALGAADWLSFAAAPTFAVMAVLAGVLGGPPDMLCASAGDASAITGMAPMYALMSAFHAAPWLRLVAGRRSSPHRT
ncbi:hypothetical protein [Ensifer sp. BR816]|uniref:hypothetical protein n=1 Tax=Rhizobium sp. (strain BR816) TaxID=1057002 RepID=UPI00039B2966|nr:hypothetical protein [Ensifer sp. BR816]